MTASASGADLAGMATTGYLRVPPRLRGIATTLAVLSSMEVLLWAVLAAANGRPVSYLVNQNELAAAVFALACAVTAAVVLRQNPRHALGWLFLLVAQLEGLAILLSEYAARRPSPPMATPALIVGDYLWLPGLAISAALFTPLFPDGRPASPRWRPLVWAGAVCVATASIPLVFISTPDIAPRRNPLAAAPPVQHVLTIIAGCALLGALGCGALGAVLLAVRMVRTSGHERRRIGWFFAAFAVAAAARALPVSPVIPAIAVGFFPAALGVAMLRHRLFDGDRLLSRTLVYGVLTAGVAGVFGLTVGLASSALGGDGTGAVVAAVIIALGVSPARDFVQRAVDRLLYGGRRDPYAALSRLGAQLSGSIAADDVLPVIVRTVRTSLRLPYVAVTLAGDTQPTAADGVRTQEVATVPLRNAGAEVGTLTVGLRDKQRFLDSGDEQLLQVFAQQAGATAEGVRLNRDLRRSYDDIAVARDEERHRIQRDLHDGLGPTLAGMTLGLDAAQRSVQASAPETAELLATMAAEVKSSLGDIRRLVADLRPTSLDQLGLVEALRQYADTVSLRSEGTLEVRIVAPAPLPALPAAMEVVAFRVIMEAVANVVRHSGADLCVVDIAASRGFLRLTVTDNGCGMPGPERPRGLGLRSMAERAAELGGECVTTPGPDGGTVVTATIPLRES
jgi:two-component system, NarL family, sensor kinase